MSFASIRRRCLARSGLSKARYGEDATYLPADGGEATVRVMCQPATRQLRERQAEVVTAEEIDVRVARDPEFVDPVDGTYLGGIESPQLGDGLVRGGDPPDRAFSFEFVLKATAETWLLRFSRERQEQVGVGQMQK